jgi:hypothetical protein
MRTSLAVLMIFFPLFLAISYFWNKYIKFDIGNADKVIKKWIIYLIIFLASLTIVIDLVTLVRYFVSGEITSRFIWKVFSVLVIAFIAGFYYLSVLKNQDNVSYKKRNIVVGILSSLIVLFSIVYAFSVMGSPKTQRNLRFDQKRVQDLQNLQYQVINFWQQKESLPKNLDELKNPISAVVIPLDPDFEKGLMYEYKKIENKKFELCATFSLASPKGWISDNYNDNLPIKSSPASPKITPFEPKNESWKYDIGKTCFERTIDPDLYPPYPKPVNK